MGRLCPKPTLERSVYSLSSPAGAGLRISRFGLDLLPANLLTVLLPTTDDQAAGPDVKDSPFGITQQRDTSPGSAFVAAVSCCRLATSASPRKAARTVPAPFDVESPLLATTVLRRAHGGVRPGLFRLCPYIGMVVSRRLVSVRTGRHTALRSRRPPSSSRNEHPLDTGPVKTSVTTSARSSVATGQAWPASAA